MKIFEFFEVLTLKMTLSAIIIIIFITQAHKKKWNVRETGPYFCFWDR